MQWTQTEDQLPELDHSKQVLFVVYDEQYESNQVKLGTFSHVYLSEDMFVESNRVSTLVHRVKDVLCWMPLPELPPTVKPKKSKKK